ncbi:hypothetical protein ACIBG8_28835 [Nonomuraea sp. NPDC050556]|uniref:hypothetical protein n=1 Tax=Nonomuraea sp. NPDC050556 TaxID=3364369 RepID=UPI00379ACF73
MARFAAGARRVIARALTVGGLMAAGWLLAMLFSAAPAAADTTAAPATTAAQTGSVTDDFPPVGTPASAMDNAEAMAGLNVDGLTSQSKPGLPAPSTDGKMAGTNGLVPTGGGSGPSGPGNGDAARSVFDPRLEAQCAPLACLLPPVVRTAADDPSFSPD